MYTLEVITKKILASSLTNKVIANIVTVILIQSMLVGCTTLAQDTNKRRNDGALLVYSYAYEPVDIYQKSKWEDVLVKRLGFLSYIDQNSEKLKEQGQSPLELKIQTNYRIAQAYSNLGLDYLAYLYFEKAIKLRPGNFQAIGGLSEMLGRLGQAERAEAFLLESLVQDPENEFLYKKLGDLYYVSGRPHLAIVPYRRAIELKPDWQIAPFLLLVIDLMELQQKSEFEGENPAVENDPWTQLLSDFIAGNRSEEDIINYIEDAKFEERVPLLSEALFYVGEVYRAKGDKKKAKRYLHQVINMKVTHYIETAFAKGILKYQNNEASSRDERNH